MGFHYRFSRGDRVQIISGKFKGETGTVDANVFQWSVDFPKDHLPRKDSDEASWPWSLNGRYFTHLVNRVDYRHTLPIFHITSTYEEAMKLLSLKLVSVLG